MILFGINKAIEYVQKEKNDFDLSLSKEELRNHVTNVAILVENIVKESIRIYGFLFFGISYIQMLKQTINIEINEKLMFGEALKGLSRLHRILHDRNKRADFNSLFSRDNVYFTKEDLLYKWLKEISIIRGSILHDDQAKIYSLEDYKEKCKVCIHLSEKALIQMKARQLFPSLLKFHKIIELGTNKQVYFEDEIGSKVPFIIQEATEIEDIKNKKWYMFKNAKIQRIIPVFSELLAWGDEEMNHPRSPLSVNDTPTMMAIGLLEINEKQKVRWYNMYEENTLIGRSEDNNLTLRFPTISRRHCRLDYIQNQIYLTDLNSTYGTVLNGKQIEEKIQYPLFEGDRIDIGIGAEQIILIFHKATITDK